MEPPAFLILNVADKSLLQATLKPRYGSTTTGADVFVGVGVKVGVGVPTIAAAAANSDVAVGTALWNSGMVLVMRL